MDLWGHIIIQLRLALRQLARLVVFDLAASQFSLELLYGAVELLPDLCLRVQQQAKVVVLL